MKPSVLFVDDSALARATISPLLRGLGLAVTAVGSVREADEVEVAGLSVALLDIELDDGLGSEVARRLRDRAPHLPIAFLSSHDGRTGSQLREEAQRFGPVFSKLSEVDEALHWIADRATCAG